MSLACKCDRCGKLYERYRGTGYGDANGFQFCRIDSKGSVESRNIEKDLCPQCLEELKGWFENELVIVSKNAMYAASASAVTYGDIYKDFIKNKWNNTETGILDWRPGEKPYTITIWIIPGDGSSCQIYTYDYNTKALILKVPSLINSLAEDQCYDTKTSI